MKWARQLIYLFVAVSLLTPVCMLLAYTDYDVLRYSPKLATKAFHAWPWIKGTLLLSSFSFLYIFFCIWAARDDEKQLEQIAIFFYGLVWIPLLAFVYPGTSKLGVPSDGRGAIAMIFISVIQTAGVYLGSKIIWRHRNGPSQNLF